MCRGRNSFESNAMNVAVSNTKEIALEQAVERRLCGASSEELAAGAIASGPFRIGQPADFDATLALDRAKFWEFLETTQSKDLDKLKQHNPADWQAKITGQLDKLIKSKGLLHVLKKGLPVDNAHFHLMYPAPLASSAQKVHDNFAANIWSVTR
ncbi:type I endonuclease restriction R subunit (plasmid) [Acetobacter pasteurianus IFO 3283-22]|nr:type I endonuclease restriction R subunit [Acetobacter pasteurianus IFO 3283-01]BAI04154.1 type I endonuclease restriction R subunit [Acetobacter pasteurianus IFO 3283-03]BAI07201.1 type I endonuclease restriction R subunit [Acetobacter pasteurianus IFO 3283-07]BAI10249.1 type I endonuclease restriction R subunit [Acetobacter pasteurianus IFO 3283-22]BAI13297.1 type I endonuclease restriction R subunit [Acetobacter pasteurianus IFO 3283-26]BAI16343.1 type I endonuclease restriction R subuni